MSEQWAPVTVGWMSRAKAQEEWECFTWKWIWANTVVQSAPIRTGLPKDGEVNKMWHADIAGLNVSHLTLLDFILDTSPPLRQSRPTHSHTHSHLFLLLFSCLPAADKAQCCHEGWRRGPNSWAAAVTQPPEIRPMSRTVSHSQTNIKEGVGGLCGVCAALVEQVITTVFRLMVERWRTRGWKKTNPGWAWGNKVCGTRV